MIREFIRANWEKMSDLEMCKTLCISHSKVERTRLKMRLIRPFGTSTMTDHDRQFIADNYHELSDAEMAEALGVTVRGIEDRRQQMGLLRRKDGQVAGILSASQYWEMVNTRLKQHGIKGEEAEYFRHAMIWSRIREVRKMAQTYNLSTVQGRGRGDKELRRMYQIQADLVALLR